VSDRLWVKPTWESVAIPPGHFVVEMDPGMSFGTGQHPTTRACLLYLDWLAARRHPPGSLLDLGCGSGILAIAGARLGFRPVLALDCDPAAVRIAAENARLNGVETAVACRVGDLASPGLAERFGVVVANVLSSVLVAHAAAVSACAAPRRAALVLSGILTAEYPAVREAYAPHGWRELDAVTIGEWTSGLLERGGGAA
jgi:ribosomal protein L11 methyltransferase